MLFHLQKVKSNGLQGVFETGQIFPGGGEGRSVGVRICDFREDKGPGGTETLGCKCVICVRT